MIHGDLKFSWHYRLTKSFRTFRPESHLRSVYSGLHSPDYDKQQRHPIRPLWDHHEFGQYFLNIEFQPSE